MSRRLQTYLLDLELRPELFTVYEGAAATLPRSDDDAVAWDLAAPSTPAHDGDWFGAGWRSNGIGRAMIARARLARSDGLYQVDDVDDPVDRTVRTPLVSPASVREWQRIELWYRAPAGTSIRFRLVDGDADWYHDGSDWLAATTPDHWSTDAQLTAAFGSFPSTARALAVRAVLRTTTTSATPEFYGARVAYGCRELDGDEGDAVVRTLLPSLRDEIRAVGVDERVLTAQAARFAIASEYRYDVTGVDAVFDLTADPDESAELGGTFAAGSPDAVPPVPAAWTATSPIPGGRRLRIEFAYRPHLVVQLDRDSVVLERTPAVYLGFAAKAIRTLGVDCADIADLTVDPPRRYEIGASRLTEQDLDVRVICERASDVRRITRSLEAWLGGSGYRTLVSPQTARLITVAQVNGFATSTDQLASGVAEARSTWRIAYETTTERELTGAPLVRSGGLQTTIEEG